MFTYSFQQIADHIQSAIDAGRDDIDIAGFEDLDDDETILSRVENYLSEARENTFAELADRGLEVNHDAKLIHVRDADAMMKAFSLTHEISLEYDCTKDPEDIPTHWWSTLGLGGDDDVDYNGSYLDTVFDIVDDMLPEDFRSREDPNAHRRDEYHLPEDVLKTRQEAYMAEYYAKYPEALATETLRARVHLLAKDQVPNNPGLTLNNDEFHLYTTFVHDSCVVFKAPRSDTGPWVFKAEGHDDITIKEI